MEDKPQLESQPDTGLDVVGKQRRHVGLLVASSGGHLLQLVQLRGRLPRAEWHWVTFDTADARTLLADESITFAFHPTNRNIINLMWNTVLAVRMVSRLRPALVVTTGAGVAVPFCWVGRLFGARVVYIESFARTSEPSLTGRLVHPIATRFFVQWPDLVSRYRNAEFLGSLF